MARTFFACLLAPGQGSDKSTSRPGDQHISEASSTLLLALIPLFLALEWRPWISVYLLGPFFYFPSSSHSFPSSPRSSRLQIERACMRRTLPYRTLPF
ncbi:uncharacterized protein LY89DRAFT_209609 [Mollisia scopiformis]|uniref:Uncharacterized protein n=1 Tax=Mollisia scopiformis TaxID=149040 RepID=A0A194WXW6_MOLSC|nr:uncharacterized protein LY89DRAFT_209609 [Mollisia scopiformis]KUJ12534.1 hypothetical protein LY89DRAFT_209609 [Mollisia scopiformis]